MQFLGLCKDNIVDEVLNVRDHLMNLSSEMALTQRQRSHVDVLIQRLWSVAEDLKRRDDDNRKRESGG